MPKQSGGELRICNLQHVRDKEEASRANLHCKEKLCKLIFEWNSMGISHGNDEEVLGGLRPHSNLQSLIVRPYPGENIRSWMLRPLHGSNTGLLLLDSLLELELIGCINCKSLPPLGQLHSLQFLKLKNMEKVTCMGNEFYCNESSDDKNEVITVFSALKSFTLEEMKNLEEWTAMAATFMFPCLEELDIYKCPLLKSVPLTGQCSSLEKLHIGKCSNLCSIGDGLATSMLLKELTIVECSNLRTLPNLNGFSTLRNLHVSQCRNLKIVPITGACSSLEKLRISGCTILSMIGNGLSTSTCLKELKLYGCPNLSSVPILEGFSSLQNLSVSFCDKLENFPVAGICSSHENVRISWCQKLSKIGDGLSTSTCLKELSLSNCYNLSSIPDLEGFSSLQILEVVSCYNLGRVPLTGPLSSLRTLRIRFCPNLRSLPSIDGLSSLMKLDCTEVGEGLSCLLPSLLQSNSSLCNLTISGLPDLISIPECLGNLHSLYDLTIMGCPRLKNIEDDTFGSLTCLEKLKIGGFSEELEELPGLNSIQHRGASLRFLYLIGWEKLKSLPHQLQHLTALEDLTIERFQAGIEALPEWLGNLASLQRLQIVLCDHLMYLPSVDVMRSLSKLETFGISCCPQLKKKCAKESGPEWPKISHVPYISID